MRKINTMELGIAFFFTTGLSILGFHMLLNLAVQDAWMSVVWGTILGMIGIFFFCYIQRYNVDGLFLLIKTYFGSYLGTFLNLILLFLVFMNTCFLTGYLATYVNTWYLKVTPTILLILLFLLIAIYAFHNGSGTLFRSINIFFYLAILFFVLLVLGSFSKMHFEYLLPSFEKGIRYPFFGALLYSLFSVVPSFLFLIVPKKKVVDSNHSFWKILFFYFLGSLFNLFFILAISTILNPKFASIYQNPEYIIFAKASLFSSIEKLQSIMALVVILIVFVNMTFSFYFVNESLTQLFHVNHKKKMRITIPILLLVLIVSISMTRQIAKLMISFYPLLLLSIFLLFSILVMRLLFSKKRIPS